MLDGDARWLGRRRVVGVGAERRDDDILVLVSNGSGVDGEAGGRMLRQRTKFEISLSEGSEGDVDVDRVDDEGLSKIDECDSLVIVRNITFFVTAFHIERPREKILFFVRSDEENEAVTEELDFGGEGKDSENKRRQDTIAHFLLVFFGGRRQELHDNRR